MKEINNKVLGLWKDSIAYGFGSSLSMVLYVILTPILTRIFSPGEYGVMDLIATTQSIMISIAGLYLENSLMRYFHDKKGLEQKAVLTTNLISVILFSVIFSCLAFIFSRRLSTLILKSTDDLSAFCLSIFAIPFSTLLVHIFSIWRMERKSGIVILASTLNILTDFVLIMFLSLRLHMGVKGVFLAKLINDGIFSCVCLFLIRKRYAFVFSKPYFIKNILFSLPLIPVIIPNALLPQLGKYMLMKSHGPDLVAIFSIGQKVSMLVGIMLVAFRQAWPAFTFSAMHSEDSGILYAEITNLYLKVMIFASLIVTVFAKFIIALISPNQYYGASQIVGLLTGGSLLYGLAIIFNTGILLKEKTYYYTIANILTVVINILLNILLIPRYGILGASLSSFLSYLLFAMSVFFISNKLHFIPYNMKFILPNTIFFILYMWVISPLQSTFLKLAIACLLFLLIYRKNEFLKIYRFFISLSTRVIPN